MGKLNIAHHKSYHPYRRDNIERVRQDEEKARLQELKEEGKMLMADSEARIDLLRNKAYKGEGVALSNYLDPRPSNYLITSNGHINLFAASESSQVSKVHAVDAPLSSGVQKEQDRGVALAPSDKDLKPWYTAHPAALSHSEDRDGTSNRSKSRIASRLAEHDPLSIIKRYTHKNNPPKTVRGLSRPLRVSSGEPAISQDQLTASRLNRESREKARAMELIRQRRQAEDTSTTASSTPRQGYTDVYNQQETSDAGKRRRRQY